MRPSRLLVLAAAGLMAAAGTALVVARDDAGARAGALRVEPASLRFGAADQTRDLLLVNPQATAVGFTVVGGDPWLSAIPAAGIVPAGEQLVVSLRAERVGIPAGETMGSVQVRTVDGSVRVPVVVQVDRAVVASGPARLEVAGPLALGASETAADLRIVNLGGEQLAWRAAAADPWLALTPSQGTLAGGATGSLAVSVDRSRLATGQTTSSITIASDGGDAIVEVHVLTAAIPLLAVAQQVLDFGAAPSGTVTRDLEIRNSGRAPLRYQASIDRPWLRIRSGADATIPAGGAATLRLDYAFGEAPEGRQELALRLTSDGGDATVAIRALRDSFAPYAQDRTMGDARRRCVDGACGLHREASATVTDDSEITDVQVRYHVCEGLPENRITCGEHRYLPMRARGGGVWTAEVGPLPSCAPGGGRYIRWWIYTEDSVGNVRLLPGTKTAEVRHHCRTDGSVA